MEIYLFHNNHNQVNRFCFKLDFTKSFFMDTFELVKILNEKSIEHGNIISISTKNIFNVNLLYKDYFCSTFITLLN